MVTRTDVCWYPMHSTYATELKVKAALDSLHVESYIPMKYEMVERGSERHRELVPAIHNLIFVHESREAITALKMYNKTCSNMQYMTNQTAVGAHDVMIVPDRQMTNFMNVATQLSDSVVFLRYDDFLNKEGRKVRIVDGNFAGVEGVIKRIKKNRVVVVMLDGIAAVAITEVNPEYLEFI